MTMIYTTIDPFTNEEDSYEVSVYACEAGYYWFDDAYGQERIVPFNASCLTDVETIGA